MRRTTWLRIGGLALFVLGMAYVALFVGADQQFREIAVPGSATVHLPAGRVDVTICGKRPDDKVDGVQVPALNLRVVGSPGAPQPVVFDDPRARSRYVGECQVQTRIWRVETPADGNYDVTIEGAPEPPFESTLTLGRYVWDDWLLALMAVATVVSSAVALPIGLLAMVVLAILVLKGLFHLFGTRPTPADAVDDAPPEPLSPRPVDGVHDWPPPELVLPYPPPPGRIGSVVATTLVVLVFIGVPLGIGIASFLEPGPISWLAVAACGVTAWAVTWALWRVRAKRMRSLRRQLRGEGWLRLSDKGFELHGRSGRPRFYPWQDIEAFSVIETEDGQGGVSRRIGIHFTPQRRRDDSWILRRWWGTTELRSAQADRHLEGYWEEPLEDAVALLNTWLLGFRANREDAAP